MRVMLSGLRVSPRCLLLSDGLGIPPPLSVSRRSQVQLFTHAGTTCGNTQITFPLDFGTATLDGLVCPAAAGSAISPGMTLTLPTAAPSGTYDVTIDAKDNSSNEIYCLQAVFDL